MNASGPLPKALFVVPSLSGGGAERNIVWLAGCWREAGGSAALLTVAGTGDDVYRVPDGVVRHALELRSNSRGVLQGLRGNVRRVLALRRIVLDSRPDVLVSFMVSANVLSAFATRGTGTVAVLAERNNPARTRLSAAWRVLRRVAYAMAERVVAQTTVTASWLARHTGARDVGIVPNPVVHPVPTMPPELDPDDTLPPNAPLVLAVGRLVAQKGFDTLLDAFAAAHGAARHAPPAAVAAPDDWHLVVLGEGDPAPLRARAERLGIAGRVHFPGRAGNVARWYSRATLFVLSSRWEGFPNALIEAMASGLPVVATRCETGPADIVEPEVSGLLVPIDDVGALAAALDRLAADAPLRARLGSAAISVRERFDEQAVFARWVALCEAALASARRRG